MGWLSGWKYRKQITIAGTADGIQTNYQMKLVIHRSAGADAGGDVYLGVGRCESDYDDIRITSSDGATLRDYWVESSDVNSATIWIEFDSIAASPANTNFYIYYGNQGAAAYSNGKNTFPLFDHFTDASLDLTTWTKTGTVNLASSEATIVSTTGIIDSIATYPVNRRFRARAKHTSNSNVVALGFRDSLDYAAVFASNYPTGNVLNAENYNPFPTISSVNLGDVKEINYAIFEILRNSTTNVKYYLDDVLATTIATDVPTGSLNIRASANAENIVLDWVFVSNYTGNEPTWSTWGNEENFILGGMSMSGCGR